MDCLREAEGRIFRRSSQSIYDMRSSYVLTGRFWLASAPEVRGMEDHSPLLWDAEALPALLE
jgi:hypothetical protein